MFENSLDYVCDYCSRPFTRKYNLQVHIGNCHVNASSRCEVCGQTFNSLVGLQLHYERGHNTHGEPSPECDICGRIFTRKQNVVSHMITTHLQGSGLGNHCPECNKGFSSDHNLKRHMTQVHTHREHTCDECQKIFKSKHALISHINTHHSKVSKGEVKCYLCDRSYCNPRNLKRHVEMHHGDKEEYRCDICPKVYTSNQSLRRHVKTNHDGEDQDEFTCDFCSKVIIGKNNLDSHMHCFHSEILEDELNGINTPKSKVKYSCDECGTCFLEEPLLRQHVKADHSFAAFYEYCKNFLLEQEAKSKKQLKQAKHFCCDICNSAFDSLYELKNHISIHDSKYNVSKCNVCYKKFYKDSMIEHKKICLPPIGINACSLCDKLFTEKCSLEFHTRIFHPQSQIADPNITSTNHDDSDSFIFKCSNCDHVYHSDRSLKHHVKLKHTTDEEIECICGKICNNQYHLTAHMKIAHNEELAKCDYCEKGFKSKRNIRRHIEFTHLGRRLNKCLECDSLFKEKRSLRKHIRIKHPNSSVFPQCHICRKRFESTKSCMIHLKLLHSYNMKIYSCHLCSQSFSSEDTLYSHQRTKHLKDEDAKYRDETASQNQDNFARHNELCNATIAPKIKPMPHCVLCNKDFSTRKTLKRHIKKFHNEFNFQELANYGSRNKSFTVNCEECIKNIRDDTNFHLYQKLKKERGAIVFSCNICSKLYNVLEYSIQRYILNTDNAAKSKLVLSELCTAEMSDDEIDESGFGMFHQIMEAESTSAEMTEDGLEVPLNS